MLTCESESLAPRPLRHLASHLHIFNRALICMIVIRRFHESQLSPPFIGHFFFLSPKILQRFSRDSPEILQRFSRDSPEILQRFYRDSLRILPGFFRDGLQVIASELINVKFQIRFGCFRRDDDDNDSIYHILLLLFLASGLHFG